MVYALAVICSLLFLAADQISKYIVVQNMTLGGESIPVIDGFFRLTYIHNEGGAWGFMEGHTWLLLSFTVVAMIVCLALLVKAGTNDKFLFWAICLILSGGIGNMIDRTLMGYVVDFVDFRLINFAVFNVADIFVCVGCGLMFLWLFKFAEFDDEKKPEKKSAVTESAEESDDASDR